MIFERSLLGKNLWDNHAFLLINVSYFIESIRLNLHFRTEEDAVSNLTPWPIRSLLCVLYKPIGQIR